MKMLIMSPRFPWPLDRGDRLTIYKYLEYFSSRGHKIHFLTFAELWEEIEQERISGFCEEVVVVPHSRLTSMINCLKAPLGLRPFQVAYYSSERMKFEVEKQLANNSFDILYAHTIRMAQYLEDVPHTGKVLAMQISMALTFRRMMENDRNPLKKLFAMLEYFLVRDYEAKITRKFSTCCLISKTDLAEIEKRIKVENVFMNPHGVDHEKFEYSGDLNKREKDTLIFSGNMGYVPNVDAVSYFVKEIFPLILREVPDCRLKIVGRRPTATVQKLGKHQNIEVTGEVPDMGEYLRHASVGINPMRIGSGLQNKVIEALACGLPMVVSSIANEGIGAEPGRDLLLADTPGEFAQKVVHLLNDDKLRLTLMENGRKFIERQYTWEYFLEQLETKMKSLIN